MIIFALPHHDAADRAMMALVVTAERRRSHASSPDRHFALRGFPPLPAFCRGSPVHRVLADRGWGGVGPVRRTVTLSGGKRPLATQTPVW